MDCLYDANIWVALSFGLHPHFNVASQELQQRKVGTPAMFCRVTQHAFLRLVTTPALQRAYHSPLISNADALAKYRDLLTHPQIGWLDEPVGCELLWHRLAGLNSASPKVWMDAYLAAFAIGHDAEFVTFDADFRNFEKDGLKLRLLTP